MDLDLSNLSWEQKALIGIGAVVLIILIYAYGPWNMFSSEPANDTANVSVSDVPSDNSPKYASVNQQQSNNNDSTNNPEGNNNSDGFNNQQKTTQITTVQAKEIAAQDGLTAGNPRSGTFNRGNETIQVWIVPLSENNVVVKDVYVDKFTGEVVATQDVGTAPQNSENTNNTF